MTRSNLALILFYLALPLLIGLSAGRHGPVSVGPLARVAGGTLRGRIQGDTAIFEGIPFAAPPVGDLRWREPQPVAPWSGVRAATSPGSPCFQPSTGIDTFLEPLASAYGAPFETQTITTSENCLYLNVWSPGWPAPKRLPVMVWLHGGSNKAGSGGEEAYNGFSLAAHGVIVVTLNYRLGVMGFFSHPGLTDESPHHSSGNYGLLDQIAALKWVQQNIASFGGDPANVTLFGESAGSIDAATLVTSPLTQGLFRRVIEESGPAFGLGKETTLVQAQALGAAVGKAATERLGTPADELNVLRRMSAAEVANLEDRMVASQFKSFDPNASIVDGWLLPMSPAKAFASGNIQRVDLLVGLNGRELSAFRVGAAEAARRSGKRAEKGALSAAVKQLADTARPLYGAWSDVAVAAYLAQALVHGDVAVDQASNDILMACPIGAEAALTTVVGAKAFVYRFDRSVPGPGEAELGAFHGLEVPYVFNTFTARVWRWLPVSQTDLKLSATMETYWTNFAKTGNPNSAGLPSWKAWTVAQEPHLQFNQAGEAVPRQDFSPLFCHLSPQRLKLQLAGG